MSEEINLRVWAENVKPKEVREQRVVNLLKKYKVNLGLSLPYGNLSDEYARLLELYEKENIKISLWLLLPREKGYWPGERNVDLFYEYLKEVFQWAKEKGVRIPWIAVDLEMPLNQFDEIKNHRTILGKAFKTYKILKSNRNQKRFKQSTEKYREVLNLIHKNQARAITAAIPLIMEDVVKGNTLIQDILETPITTVSWDCVSLMIYNSANVGYGRGLVRKKDAEYILFKYCQEAKEFFKERAGVSIGLTYTGVFGDEPYYRLPLDIASDVSAVLASGIRDIAIYNLEGILRASKPEQWFEVVLQGKETIPPPTLRVKMFRQGVRLFPRIF